MTEPTKMVNEWSLTHEQQKVFDATECDCEHAPRHSTACAKWQTVAAGSIITFADKMTVRRSEVTGLTEDDIERTMTALETPPEKTYTDSEVTKLVLDAYDRGFEMGMRGARQREHAQAIVHGDPAASFGAAVAADLHEQARLADLPES